MVKEKSFTKGQLVRAILITAALTLGGVLLLLAVLLGPHGLSVMEGFVLIRTVFVEDADLKEVADQALFAMADATGDRWSYYLDADWNKAQIEYEANRTTGIGLRGILGEDGMLITDLVPGGGADQAGLKAGEIIRAVDSLPLYGEEQAENFERIKGESGTQATLTILDMAGETRTVSVTRGTWFDPPVRSALLENNVGYVRIFNFNSGVNKAFQTAVDDLVAQGAEALVFDVRQNGGGYVDELKEMLDYLLPEGMVFRQTTSWGWSFNKRSDADCIDLPMAVLMDGESYSCAELFAGQLRESVGAYLVGEHTSGKGYFQYHFPMPNGGSLGLSIGRYSTGAGVSLAGIGLEPDEAISLTETQLAYLNARWLRPEEDPQLQAALGWLETK